MIQGPPTQHTQPKCQSYQKRPPIQRFIRSKSSFVSPRSVFLLEIISINLFILRIIFKNCFLSCEKKNESFMCYKKIREKWKLNVPWYSTLWPCSLNWALNFVSLFGLVKIYDQRFDEFYLWYVLYMIYIDPIFFLYNHAMIVSQLALFRSRFVR